MHDRSNKGRISRTAARSGGAILLSLASFPPVAEAEQRRAGLAVSAVVRSACQVSDTDVRCSSGTSWSAAASTTRAAARPLVAASSMLGEPVRREGRIVLAAPAPATIEAAGETAYLTVTY